MSMGFIQARAVWLGGRRAAWNQAAGFLMDWEGGRPASIRITGADCYRMYCNGEFAGYGPARTAHGYARVDEWPLGHLVRPGRNVVAIEVYCYGVDSYAYVLQKPFVVAEVVSCGEVVAATGGGTKAFVLRERIQKVERFSKQRPMAEAYRLTPECHEWRLGEDALQPVACEPADLPELLPRGVRLPEFDCIAADEVVERGTVVRKDPAPDLPRSARDMVGKRVMGYSADELEIDMMGELNQLGFVPVAIAELAVVGASGYAVYDFGTVQGGFIGVRLQCEDPTRVYLFFDEVPERGEGHRFTLGVSAIALDLEAGAHEFESIEPYTFRYLRVIALHADVEVKSVYVREYAHPACDLPSVPDDPELAKILRAARQTFRTNSIDLFTDCMSRERGGYPCDSWFTARAERVFAGESLVERNFLENYFLVEKFAAIPEGMVPHCYPSDRLGKGQYIPNWGLWLVYQLCDYLKRNDDPALLELARPRVEALFKWFEPSINELGLLEDVPGWIFVEWSKANEVTDAVNHPTNMLYAATLASAAEIFARHAWADKAKQCQKSIFEQSWDGRWFADQSIRVEGELERSEVRTETCQYHALYFDVAGPEDCGDLWERLRDGVMVKADGLEPAGLLYGLMLRFDLLQRYGEWKKLLSDVRRVFGPQATQTGTLWEHVSARSSCNHGFASCAAEYIIHAEEGIKKSPRGRR